MWGVPTAGFVLSERRILTNAHAVMHYSAVQVRKHGSPDKVDARVVAIGHDSDTALLAVDDESFWAGLGHLELGELPELQERVTVVGYPTGGDNISVTAGVVSRVDLHRYSLSYVSLLAIQIDAAINSGNSGGPAFDHTGKVRCMLLSMGHAIAVRSASAIPWWMVRVTAVHMAHT